MEISVKELIFQIDIIARYFKLDLNMSVQEFLNFLAEELMAANPGDEEVEDGKNN